MSFDATSSQGAGTGAPDAHILPGAHVVPGGAGAHIAAGAHVAPGGPKEGASVAQPEAPHVLGHSDAK